MKKEMGMNGWQALGFNSYQEYLLSDIWTSKRDFLLKQYPMCEICKEKKSQEVHHIDYDSVGNEGKEHLLVLCKECHLRQHPKETK